MSIAPPVGLLVLDPVEHKVTYQHYPSKAVRDELFLTRSGALLPLEAESR
ncbi:hypothetical protein KZZ20_09150 [Methylacidiphilum fumariolicum]|uniref:Uncharacterized protein n=3 Tax=Candidatus Methylacidiphilum fumarolicum TaxID=591154 RepID=I0JX83_METFB|nr:hypothetical protein [Candidatus Methylacidiphilum fumarolicum]MBW6415673.1 hypothetical protein [Candidatus Methylacidiphilum fumarolicum]CAI9086183.1 conserved protein of unknown function [Candidatus Methylacidiphilum fumarolicum]CCG91852.1 hypothetical protein MFUM_230031 [Methylacidiphilum fumariolicum SolV]